MKRSLLVERIRIGMLYIKTCNIYEKFERFIKSQFKWVSNL